MIFQKVAIQQLFEINIVFVFVHIICSPFFYKMKAWQTAWFIRGLTDNFNQFYTK